MKLTSPGILLIVAVIAASGIFLLDGFYLRPHVADREQAALQDEANTTRSAVMLVMRAQQRGLRGACIAWGKSIDPDRFLTASDGGRGFRLEAQKALSSTQADLAWISGPRGRTIGFWSRVPGTEAPQAPPEMPAISRMGLIRLRQGPAIFARCNLPSAREAGDAPGQLWLAQFLHGGTLSPLAAAGGGGLIFVGEKQLPDAAKVTRATDHGFWDAGNGQMAVAWLVRDPAGEVLGYLRADLPVQQIQLQATAARRMILIVLSLSMGLAVLVILGAHMLITGPVLRLLRRLQYVDDLGEGAAGEITRGLHGEPLALARKLQGAFRELAHISKTDQLTGLANRRHFQEVLDAFYHQARRYRRPLSLVILDVDYFKAVNDAGGHRAGDELLKIVAQAIRRACRKADLPGRIGGDEFAVLLPETTAGDAQAVAERISRFVAAEDTTVNAVKLNVTLSIGITDLGIEGIDSREDMVNLADRALYTAKDHGRNCIVHASDLDEPHVRSRGDKQEPDLLHTKLAGLDWQFKDLFLKAIHEIVDLLESRDPYMADHAQKVKHYGVLIARKMGLPERLIKRVEIAAMLHDIGMLTLPDSVLLCPTELDEQQMNLVRTHPIRSVQMMQGMEFLEQEIPAVRYHHERFDGHGYPEGLAGASIPLTARILTVADCFDAMVSPRTFRGAKTVKEALMEIKSAAGSQFDPAVVAAFVDVASEMGEQLQLREMPPVRQDADEPADEPQPASKA